jgi:uncharacterized membrane protein
MISNHYAMTYTHAYSWLVLAAIMAAGVLIRHFFNLRHAGKVSPAFPIAGVVLLAGVAFAIAPAPRKAAAAPAVHAAAAEADSHAVPPSAGQASLSSVQQVLTQRCVSCHSAAPTQAGFASAPGGVMLDTEAQVKQHAAKIYQRAVQNKDMPLANMTHMTDAERQLIGTWFESSAN